MFFTLIVGLCLNSFTTRCSLTLGHFSAYNRSSLSFLLIMSDKEGEEDPKVISVGSFEDLRSYLDQKFSSLFLI